MGSEVAAECVSQGGNGMVGLLVSLFRDRPPTTEEGRKGRGRLHCLHSSPAGTLFIVVLRMITDSQEGKW